MSIRHIVGLYCFGAALVFPARHVIDYVFFDYITGDWKIYVITLMSVLIFGYLGLWLRFGVNYVKVVQNLFVTNRDGLPKTRTK